MQKQRSQTSKKYELNHEYCIFIYIKNKAACLLEIDIANAAQTCAAKLNRIEFVINVYL
jgi:hypothetical protein